ncbi:MAG: aromatic amino acid ammonia-lyase [Sporolactobacillus sp.]
MTEQTNIFTEFNKDPRQCEEVTLDVGTLTLAQFIAVARYHAKLILSDAYIEKITQSRRLVDTFVNEGRAIYGVTTGLGDNVRKAIDPDESEMLQINTLRSHAVAVGTPLQEEAVRAIQLMILVNFGKGYSGVSIETIQLLKEFLNRRLFPYAPSEGSVGYLSVEAHICLPLIGEGKIWYKGKLMGSTDVLKEEKLSPIHLKCKEGLALIQGSTSVTALAVLALYNAVTVVKNAEIGGALSFESLKGTVKALDNRIHQVKDHIEQAETAQNLRAILAHSEIMEQNKNAKLQDALPLRCFPHILGAIKRVLQETWNSVYEEMNSCSDNPIILPDTHATDVLMCGNFDATYVGLHMDSMSIAMGNLAKLLERFVDRLTNRHLNDLPPFLTENPGLNNGLMILQYTAAGLTGEIKILSHPSSVDSIPTCANQEDVVSFGYFASKKAYEISKKLENILAIQLVTAVTALDFIRDLKPSPVVQELYKLIRQKVPKIDKDRYFFKDIEMMQKLIHERVLTQCIDDQIGYTNY